MEALGIERMELEELPFNPEYREGAFNAIQVCLRLQPDERVTLICDRACAEIAAALLAEIRATGARYRAFMLEDFGGRPLLHMPSAILADLSRAQVSLYAASAKPGELKIRREMIEVVNARRIRHGHMVNITHDIMLQGMRADFHQVDVLSQRLIEKARQARTVRARSRGGTDIEATFSPEIRWIKTSGLISPDKWGNLPGGEIFTTPFNVNGTFVVDGVVGNHLCQKYGDLKDTPLVIEIENGRARALRSDNHALVREFNAYIHADANSDRVGEFALGTNLAVKDIIGNILQDEKIPGLHIALGDPYSEHTRAAWSSSTHIDCVGRDFDVWFDRVQIMQSGRFVFDGAETPTES